MKLLNCYLPIFRLVYEFTLYPKKYADYAVLNETCMELLKKSTLEAEREHNKADCDAALFAVVVWLDEMILCSSLPCVTQWRSALLQMQLFQTQVGGELFFTQLDKIETENTTLQQVYLFCLLTGFHGEYNQKDKEQLQQRIDKTKLCLPKEWREWPNKANLTHETPTLKFKKQTLWLRAKNNHWLWLIIPVGLYGIMFLCGFIYFS